MDQEIDNYVNQKHDSISMCIVFAKFVVFRNFTNADHRSTGQPTPVGGMKEYDGAVQYPKYRNRRTAKLCLRFVPRQRAQPNRLAVLVRQNMQNHGVLTPTQSDPDMIQTLESSTGISFMRFLGG